MSKVAEVLERFRNEQKRDVSPEALGTLVKTAAERFSCDKAYRVWRTACQLRGREEGTFTFPYVRSWSMKEKGQVQALKNELGEDVTVVLLSEIPLQWDAFREYLKNERGHKDVSKAPAMGLLVFYRDAAIEFLERASACAGQGGVEW